MDSVRPLKSPTLAFFSASTGCMPAVNACSPMAHRPLETLSQMGQTKEHVVTTYLTKQLHATSGRSQIAMSLSSPRGSHDRLVQYQRPALPWKSLVAEASTSR